MFKALRFLLNHPLSILRFTLSVLIWKKVLEDLFFIYEITDSAHYTLSKTWFTSVLPDAFFIFDSSHFSFFHALILITTIGATIGFLWRLSLIILGILSFYVFGVSEGIGIFNHHLSLPTQVIIALALVPGSMKLSIDYILVNFYYK